MKSDEELLFRRLKDVAMRKPGRSERYKDFVREKVGFSCDLHHTFGSLGSLKSTDYLIVPVTRQEHTVNQDNREWLFEQLPKALGYLLQYVEELEKELTKTE